MKSFLLAGFLFLFLKSNAQEAFRIQQIGKLFHNSLASGSSIEKINDSLTMKVVRKDSNFEVSLVRKDGSEICSCLYRLNKRSQSQITRKFGKAGKDISSKDSVMVVNVLEPVNENCVAQYRSVISRSAK